MRGCRCRSWFCRSAAPTGRHPGARPECSVLQDISLRGFVYILADTRRGRTYIGVISDLARRVYEHREDLVPEYTKSRSIKRLVYFDQFGEIGIGHSETSLNRWYRHWEEELIEEHNPDWRDLWDDIAR